ncbi:hypothetical protein [Bifidobacterium leontopitheci]|uniref:Uncharacterized protein n=1 Tax=Bifidobacterium leontopitheci TaxID=2650774 RepID=A0A6I1GGF0_9BIFI|nr:hypothetical protein [Bifidobacterium leontopitheci]KAB7790724.1 hypothetical protein F7D09_0830 [Bifidobacterium leontopitheci]
MRNTIVLRLAAAVALAAAMAAPLSACGQSQSSQSAAKPTVSQDAAPKTDSQGGDAPQGSNPASKQAAERYRDCLTAAGVPAQIMDGNWVVLQWTGDDSGSVSSGSTDGDRDKAIKECQAKVPDYHDPDFNTK